jgi:predicted PurR-regulated permease PerM
LLALSQGTTTALWVLGLYVGIQAVESNAITPLIQRRAVSLPPALTIVAQMVMGALAGVLGVIMATPLIAVTLVLVRRLHVDRMDMQAYECTPEGTPETVPAPARTEP